MFDIVGVKKDVHNIAVVWLYYGISLQKLHYMHVESHAPHDTIHVGKTCSAKCATDSQPYAMNPNALYDHRSTVVVRLY